MPSALRLPGILMVLAVLTSAVVLWVVALPLLNGARFADHARHVPLVYVHAVGAVRSAATENRPEDVRVYARQPAAPALID